MLTCRENKNLIRMLTCRENKNLIRMLTCRENKNLIRILTCRENKNLIRMLTCRENKNLIQMLTCRENKNGIVPHSSFLELSGDIGNCFIHATHHPRILSPILIPDIGIFIQVPLRYLKRDVYSLVRQIQEHRLSHWKKGD